MAKRQQKAPEKEGKTGDWDLFHTDHELDLKEYVRLKRIYGGGDRPPNLDIHDHFLKLDAIINKCNNFGIESKLIVDALDTECDLAREELALQLLENIVFRMDLECSGETHLSGRKKVMPDSLINEIALLMVESCGDSATPPPNSLSILLRAQFNRIEDPSFVPKDGKARDLAILLYACDRSLTTREVARAVGVHHTTVSRWKKDTNFQNKIAAVGKISNARRLLDKLVKRSR